MTVTLSYKHLGSIAVCLHASEASLVQHNLYVPGKEYQKAL